MVNSADNSEVARKSNATESGEARVVLIERLTADPPRFEVTLGEAAGGKQRLLDLGPTLLG